LKRIVVTAVALLALASAGTASAAKDGVTLGNPANVCRAFMMYDVGGYSSFEQCTTNLMADAKAYRFFSETGQLESPFERCAEFEAGVTDPETGEFFQLTYPFTFFEDPSWPFPVYTAHNRVQCGLTIYAYHTFVGVTLEGGE